jgi:two-component system, response regulator PdtaR
MSLKPGSEGGAGAETAQQPLTQNRISHGSARREQPTPATSPSRLAWPADGDTRRPLRIIIADADPVARASCQRALRALGCDPCVAQTGRQLLEQCQALRPGLVIAELSLPEMDGMAALRQVCAEQAVAIMLLSSAENAETLQTAAGNDYVFACLCKPIPEAAWGPAIAATLHRFRQFQSLMKEATDLRNTLEDRKLVERAKGVVMRYCCVDEGEAYQRMKRFASNHNRKLAEVGRMILSGAEVFQSLDQLEPAAHRNKGNGQRHRQE